MQRLCPPPEESLVFCLSRLPFISLESDKKTGPPSGNVMFCVLNQESLSMRVEVVDLDVDRLSCTIPKVVVCPCLDAQITAITLMVALGLSYLQIQRLDPVFVIYKELEWDFIVSEQHWVDMRQVLASKVYSSLTIGVIHGLQLLLGYLAICAHE